MVRLSVYSRLAIAVLFAAAAAATADKRQSTDDSQVCTTDANGHQVCYPRLFNATDEFQAVLPGQDLPPGLHVQINMSSGERLAKLMAPEPGKDLAVAAVPDDKPANSPKDHSRQRGFGSGYKPAAAEGFQTHIDSVVELSASMDRSQTDFLHNTLLAMEDLVHDTRYADELIHRPRGAASLLRLSDTNAMWPATIRQLASVVLGAALQNNPRAQESLFADGALPLFIDNVVRETDARALGKHVFALSALVRGNNQALAEFAGEHLRSLRAPLTVVGDRRVRDSAEVRVVRLVEDVLNSELHPDFLESAEKMKKVFAASASAWCGELADRLRKELVEPRSEYYERPLAYAHALQVLRSQYPDECSLSSELQHLARSKATQIGNDESTIDYRQALSELV
ncbi:nucleotide exchange factor sil1 [Coemansia linderi]|uniref:Nucleotide exchange factor sil1 n=1 Tax=Coemansia linderi TaxID=2663919 RepID=A0ACC1KPU0_9FUNG|nr:nucleotide exchange factor sil1 [Coemansia linderi]